MIETMGFGIEIIGAQGVVPESVVLSSHGSMGRSPASGTGGWDGTPTLGRC